MSGYLDKLGITPIVNAKGPATRLSGAVSRPEVAAAVAEAMQVCVDIVELQARASEVIARHTGAQAGLVTCGAAAGLLAGAAACVTGKDPGAIARLPEIRHGRDELVMVRSQRNQYDHALRTVGLKVVEVGLPDRYAGAGCRDAEPWEIADAIGPRTALVHWVADAASQPPLPAVVEVAHKAGVPVVADAAAQLPPASNLRRFIEAGADLVAFSGGKAMGGPQASGILCGRRDLIEAAALNMLDMDYPQGFFRPPSGFIDAGALAGLPPHGIARPCKVGKEQIVGLLTALELFTAEGDETRRARWLDTLRQLQERLGDVPGVATSIREDADVPLLVLSCEGGRDRSVKLYDRLVSATPAIHTDPEELDAGRLLFNPIALGGADVARWVADVQMLISRL